MDVATVIAEWARHDGSDATGLRLEPVAYAYGSPATAGLWALREEGSAAPTAFVKLLRHVRHWPQLGLLPPQAREHFVREFPWRFEYDLHLAGIGDVLPPGMREPGLLHVAEPDSDHVLLFWEWVEHHPGRWSSDDYALAARALGRLAARRREELPGGPVVTQGLSPGRGMALRYYVGSRIVPSCVPVLSDPATWRDPALAAAADLSGTGLGAAEFARSAAGLDAALDRLDDLPNTYAHGDASPQNLLRPVAEPGVLVAVDWGFGTPLAVGFDLGQLLLGLVHAGVEDAAAVPGHAAVAFPAYCAGLAAEGWDVPDDTVREGFLLSLFARSAFDLPLEDVGAPPTDDVVAHLADRLRLARVVLDLTAPVR